MKKISVALAVLSVAGNLFAAAEVGKLAPDFTGMDIQGKTVKLSDYKGKLVVLELYKLHCPFCANHFKSGRRCRRIPAGGIQGQHLAAW